MISINGKASYIGTLVLQITTVDNRQLAIKPPTIIPRLPRSIKNYLTWKGTFVFFCMVHTFLIIILQFIFSSDLTIWTIVVVLDIYRLKAHNSAA